MKEESEWTLAVSNPKDVGLPGETTFLTLRILPPPTSVECVSENGYLQVTVSEDSPMGSFDDLEIIRSERDDLSARCAALEAKIDALMLEHCPSEMTAEQREKWAKHQEKV